MSKKFDSCDNYVKLTPTITSYATKGKFKICCETSCNSKYVVYVAYCVRCGKQGVGSTVSWKPRLANYKSHIKKRVASCKIVRHFIEDCVDHENPSSLIRFIIVDIVNNNENLDENNENLRPWRSYF